MKILVIEDNEYKFNDIKKYLSKLGENDIIWKKSRNSGLREILNSDKENTLYNMVITDNMLPLHEDEPYDIDAYGVDITNEIRRRYEDKIIVCICSSDDINEDNDANYTIKYDMSIELSPVFEAMITDAYAYKALKEGLISWTDKH